MSARRAALPCPHDLAATVLGDEARDVAARVADEEHGAACGQYPVGLAGKAQACKSVGESDEMRVPGSETVAQIFQRLVRQYSAATRFCREAVDESASGFSSRLRGRIKDAGIP